MASKLVFGDQLQIRLNPEQLERKNRREWGDLYLSHQAEKARMFFGVASLSLAAMASAVAAAQIADVFLFIALVLCFLAVKSSFHFGYRKGILDDWESKMMVRIDK